MPIKMLFDANGAENATGAKTKLYKAGETLPDTEFGKALGKTFIEAGLAEEIKVVEPMETKSSGKRARNKKGQLMADNPETTDYNEAWEGGIAPK